MNTITLALPALVTLAALMLYFIVTFNVGRARKKYGVAAPAVTGNADFERAFRVQQNTLEQLVFFLPCLWLFAIYLSPLGASILGAIWVIGRILYAIGYYKELKKRGPGFIIGILASAILWLGALWGVIGALVLSS